MKPFVGAAAIISFLVPTAARAQERVAWNEQGVVATHASPHSVLRQVPVRAVRLDAGFWAPRLETNRVRSLPSLLELLEQNGVVDNFRRLSGRKQAARRGPLYTDSDLFKWMEAAALALQSGEDPEIRRRLDAMIDEVAAAQGKDGYLNTYYALERASERFSDFRHGHELYCLGHLAQAGIAHYRATGERKLLDVAVRYADYVVATLGPGKKPAFTGHPELEMALIELYRTTGERRYLDFAGYLLDAEKPELKLSERDANYAFSGVPFTSRKQLEGHSVRAMYACAGAADYWMETGAARFRETLETLWSDLTARKMYVTGGVGSRQTGEAIGEPYELPNEQAYTETCAAIGNSMWNLRMLAATGEARFADVAERALYNGVLSGVSLSGDQYFYRNPLSSLGRTARRPWYSTTCCPPNIQRTLAALPGYMYSTSPKGLWVHLYHGSGLNWRLQDGRGLRVVQKTDYPWGGGIELTLMPESRSEFGLFLRIPGWCRRAVVQVNGGPHFGAPVPGSYFEITRVWQPGDTVRLDLEMAVTPIEANPRARENFGRVALMRGPLVYCLEAIDLPSVSPFDVALRLGNFATIFGAERPAGLLGGVTVIRAPGLVADRPSLDRPLYGEMKPGGHYRGRFTEVRLIPYYAWANRGLAEMEVWLPWTNNK